MAVHYRTQGFFIKKADRGEANQLFTIYTKDFGKLRILGKAIRKIKSKLRGGAELFYLSEIEFIQGKTSKTLTDTILIKKFPNIRKDFKKTAVARRISIALDGLIGGEEPDKETWDLTNEVFEKLDSQLFVHKQERLEIIYYYFIWNLFSILGYLPELKNCSVCGKKVHVDVFKILRIILKKDWEILSRLKIEPLHYKLLKEVSENYFDDIIRTWPEPQP